MAPAKKARVEPNSSKDKVNTSMQQKAKRKAHDSSNQSFKIYILRVLKMTAPEGSIGKKAMSIMDSCISDIFENICHEASKLVRYHKKKTLTAKEIQSAVKLLFPGELAKHAITEGAKVCVKR